jgi:hypothetical protein
MRGVVLLRPVLGGVRWVDDRCCKGDEGGRRSPARSVYFSFATLTTVGYRIRTARTDLRRTPALMEALVGQLYLVRGVSGGVANLVPRRRLDGGDSQ